MRLLILAGLLLCAPCMAATNLALSCANPAATTTQACDAAQRVYVKPVATTVVNSGNVWKPFGTLIVTDTLLVCSADLAEGAATGLCPAANKISVTKASLTAPVPPTPTWTGTATLSWVPPTQNTDGSALTNLAGYTILYGTSAAALTQSVQIDNPVTTTYVITGLAPGTWYAAIKARTSTGIQSELSNVVSKTITAPVPPAVVSVMCSLAGQAANYANGDQRYTLRCPQSALKKADAVTVTRP